MQKHDTDAVALIVFGLLFGFVTLLGFIAARWRRGDLKTLDEWGLGGRRFGTIVTWSLCQATTGAKSRGELVSLGRAAGYDLSGVLGA